MEAVILNTLFLPKFDLQGWNAEGKNKCSEKPGTSQVIHAMY